VSVAFFTEHILTTGISFKITNGAYIRMDKVIALGSRLKDCNNVLTLGVFPNFSDYNTEKKRLIQTANKIYYPTQLYAELFDSINKSIFPSAYNYMCAQDKIKQSILFNLLDIPHPRTRVFYGKKQKSQITKHFAFPFIAKIPRGSSMGSGVFLIKNQTALNEYLDLGTPAYIQEYLPTHGDMRIVVIGKKIVHAYRRIAAAGEFRSNIARGAKVSLATLPQTALDLALQTAKSCQWDDVGLDICEYKNKLYVLEGNMKYGKEGFRAAGIDYIAMMEHLIENKEI
jgi:ribosomal protein S6--L-glutamate ligase